MLFRHATVLTMDPEVGELPSADVLVEGSKIAAVAADLSAFAPGHEVIDASGCLVVPGFIDTHRHMWEGMLRASLAHVTLDDYFDRVLFGASQRMTAADVGLSESLSALAALDAGITTVQDTSDINDSPERTDAIVDALRQSGLRAVFAYGLPMPFVKRRGAALPDDVQRIRREALSDDDALVTMALSVPNGDDEAEQYNARLAADLDVLTARHVRASILPSRLKALGALRPGTTFVHGNGLSAKEFRIMADSGGSLSVAPFIEIAMQLGTPMVAEALSTEGLNTCLSIDVEVTGPTDMFTQMKLAYLAARTSDVALSVKDVLAMATINGAKALGLQGVTGSVTVGKEADLLVLDATSPSVSPMSDPYETLVLQMDRACIDTVIVGGVVHKRGGRMVADRSRLYEDAARARRRLLAS